MRSHRLGHQEMPMCHAIVIEDEPLIALHMADLAEEAGATSVELVETEGEAIRAAQRQKPDIILSDVRLKAGSGPDAVVAIRRELGHIPVIFVTASPELCSAFDPPSIVLNKPVAQADFIREFARLAPDC
jgi:CheY-like chemotaxis protein